MFAFDAADAWVANAARFILDVDDFAEGFKNCDLALTDNLDRRANVDRDEWNQAGGEAPGSKVFGAV